MSPSDLWSEMHRVISFGLGAASTTRPDAAATGELTVLHAAEQAGFRVARGVAMGPEDALSDALATLELSQGAAYGVLVRALYPTDAPFSTVVALEHASLAWARDAAGTIADAVGVPRSRFAASLGDVDRAGLDEAVAKMVLGAVREPFPETLEERIAFVMACARRRGSSRVWVLQRIDDAGPFGLASSRDSRTGSGPVRAQLSPGPSALADGPGAFRPVREQPELGRFEETLTRAAELFELHGRASVRFAFTLDEEGPRFLFVAPQKRTARSACALAVDLAARREITPREALDLVEPSELSQAWVPAIDRESAQVLATGVAAGPGIARGRAVFSPARALELAWAGVAPLLVVPEIEPEDIEALRVSAAIVVTRGGITGEAAIMARALGKPCVGSSSLRRGALQLGDVHDPETLYEGDALTIDGSSGLIARGAVVLSPGEPTPEVRGVLDLTGPASESVIALVGTVEDVESARRFGARRAVVWATEDLFFDYGTEDFDAACAELVGVLRAAATLGTRPALRVPERAVSRRSSDAWDRDILARATSRAIEAVGGDVERVGDAKERRWSGPDGADDASATVVVVTSAQSLAPRLAGATSATEIACSPACVPAARLALARAGRLMGRGDGYLQ